MNKNITIKTGLDRGVYLKKEGSDFIYLYVEIKGKKLETKKERLPLNLGLVIDRSGSMGGDKIRYAREAVKFVVKNLGSEDKVSLVQYDNEVDVLFPATSGKDKNKILGRIEKIAARGMTNLSGGMMEGFNQVSSSYKKEGMVNRVFLLSDGLANRGITDHEKLTEIARKAWREKGISLSSFGIGTDFNEKLMIDLAEHGGGNQFFIGLPEDIPGIFAQELQGLLAVVGQNASFSVAFPQDYLSLQKSFGMALKGKDGAINGHLGDIFSEDTKGFLLKFKVEKPIDQDLPFQFVLKYDDVVDTLERLTYSKGFVLRVSDDSEKVEASGDKAIMEQVAVFESNSRHQELLEILRLGEYDKVKQGAGDLIAFIEAQLMHFPNSEDLKAQLQTTRELYNEIDDYKNQDRYAQEMSMKHYASVNKYVEKKKMKYMAQRQAMRKDEKGSKS